jgi:DNA-binding transcriptional ArsR family regulator
MTEPAVALDLMFHALADRNRRAILSLVRSEHHAVGDIAEKLNLSQQMVSHHLKVLRAASLVTGERSGTRHLFSVQPDGMAVGQAFFDDFWPDRLRSLKRAVESTDPSHG